MMRHLSLILLIFGVALMGCRAKVNYAEVEAPPPEAAELPPEPENPRIFVRSLTKKVHKESPSCIERRYKKLYGAGWRYRRFLWHFEKIIDDIPGERLTSLWQCDTDGLMNERRDIAAIVNFYHLGVQALGTRGNLELGFLSNDEEKEKLTSGAGIEALAFYRLFPNRSSEPFIRIAVIPEILTAYPVLDDLNADREAGTLALELAALTQAHEYHENLIRGLEALRKRTHKKEYAICPHVGLTIFIWDQIRNLETLMNAKKLRISPRLKASFKKSKGYFLSPRFCGSKSVVGR